MIRIALAVLLLIAPAAAQEHEHHHPTEVITGETALFYETWTMPDNPGLSCCSRRDCYATQARRQNGKVQALHRESHEWIDIPPEKVDERRDSPDGRSHLCASESKVVICFVLGSGT